MISLLQSLLNTISTLVTFVINTITSLIALITQIPTYVTLLTQSINILPSFLIPFMMAYISIIVVQYIINRRAQ